MAGLLGELEVNGLSRLLLHHHRGRCHPVALRDIRYSQSEKIAGPKLAVDGEIKQREIAMLLMSRTMSFTPGLM